MPQRKAAIVNFTKSLAKEAIEVGVRVNAVAPGPVWTPLIPSTMPEEKIRPWGGAAQPVELAPIYVLLASQEGSYITGMILRRNGRTPYCLSHYRFTDFKENRIMETVQNSDIGTGIGPVTSGDHLSFWVGSVEPIRFGPRPGSKSSPDVPSTWLRFYGN
jgi:hypothetical protein